MEAATQNLRRERGAAHAEQHNVGVALVADLLRELLQLVERLEHPLRDRQPAQAVGDLGCARRPPQRRVRRAQPSRDVVVSRQCHLLLDAGPDGLRYVLIDGEGLVAHATIVVTAALV